jgi:hypothetical protein
VLWAAMLSLGYQVAHSGHPKSSNIFASATSPLCTHLCKPVLHICPDADATNPSALQAPDKVRAVQVLNISLRMLHVTKQPPFARPAIAAFQRVLRDTAMGQLFFDSLAKPQTIRNVLSQAYHDPATVTDELIDCILKPGLEPGAVKVFLDFIRCVVNLL